MTNRPDLQVTAGGAVALQPVAVTRKTPRRLFWNAFADKAALAGGIVICILIFIAIFGGPIAEHITGHPQNTTYNNMTDAYGVPLGPTGSSGSAPTPPDAICSYARCTARAPRSSSASSPLGSPC